MTDVSPGTATSRALDVTDLTVTYKRSKGILGRDRQVLRAVNGVTFHIDKGEVLGLVGESGSGKSTVAQAVERLISIESGSVSVDGVDLTFLRGSALRRTRRAIQMVYQDPYSSLNPSMTIGQILTEPLLVHKIGDSSTRGDLVRQSLDRVGLSLDSLAKYPHEFSGGQRQRIAIARALITDPEVMIFDEAVSALDVSTRGQILKLLQELRTKLTSSYLFIGHDLAVVRKVSDRIAVMYLGRIVEIGPVNEVVSSPRHPYTAALLSAVPDARPGARTDRNHQLIKGDPPDPWNPPTGCAFVSRCPFAMPICSEVAPEPFLLDSGGSAECHLHTSGPKLNGASIANAPLATNLAE